MIRWLDFSPTLSFIATNTPAPPTALSLTSTVIQVRAAMTCGYVRSDAAHGTNLDDLDDGPVSAARRG